MFRVGLRVEGGGMSDEELWLGTREKPERKRKKEKTYFANALASAFLQLTFCAPTKLSTVTAMARSTSCEVQYSDRRILQKASLMRMIASRWRT